jgi:hypothetical protein
VPLDDRDDIVELDFADTSALSDVDAFERRRQNNKNAKLSKKDRATREREEIERSWDVPGSAATGVLVAAGSPGPHPVLGRPSSSQAPARNNAVLPPFANGSAAAWSSPQSGALKANQTNAGSAPVKTSEPSSTGGPATAPAPPAGNNKSIKAKSKHVVNGSNGSKSNVFTPDATLAQAQANGVTALAKSAASAAIVEAVHAHHAHPNVNGGAPVSITTDRNEFVEDLLALIHVRGFLFFFFLFSTSLFCSRSLSTDGFVVCGSTLDGVSCAGLDPLPTGTFFLWVFLLSTTTSPPSLTLHPPIPSPCHLVSHQDISVHVLSRCITLALTCIDIQCGLVTLCWCTSRSF